MFSILLQALTTTTINYSQIPSSKVVVNTGAWQLVIALIFIAVVVGVKLLKQWGIDIFQIMQPKAKKDGSLATQFFPKDTSLNINNQPYPVSIIELTKHTPETGYGSISVFYKDTEGVDRHIRTQKDRLPLDWEDDRVLNGKLCLKYLGNSKQDAKDITMAMLRRQIENDNKAFNALNERLDAIGIKDPILSSIRARQLQGAIESSRTFAGNYDQLDQSDTDNSSNQKR